MDCRKAFTAIERLDMVGSGGGAGRSESDGGGHLGWMTIGVGLGGKGWAVRILGSECLNQAPLIHTKLHLVQSVGGRLSNRLMV